MEAIDLWTRFLSPRSLYLNASEVSKRRKSGWRVGSNFFLEDEIYCIGIKYIYIYTFVSICMMYALYVALICIYIYFFFYIVTWYMYIYIYTPGVFQRCNMCAFSSKEPTKRQAFFCIPKDLGPSILYIHIYVYIHDSMLPLPRNAGKWRFTGY